MHTPRRRPPYVRKSKPSESSPGPWSKLGVLVIDKVLLVVVAAAAIAFVQGQYQRSQERLEKARRIGDISVDRPVAVVADLPAHLEAFILYAEHIRSADVEDVSSERLTALQAAINSDLEGSRAYFNTDRDLRSWSDSIKKTLTAVCAKALDEKTLAAVDISSLEAARDTAYKFHHRILELSEKKLRSITQLSTEQPLSC